MGKKIGTAVILYPVKTKKLSYYRNIEFYLAPETNLEAAPKQSVGVEVS